MYRRPLFCIAVARTPSSLSFDMDMTRRGPFGLRSEDSYISARYGPFSLTSHDTSLPIESGLGGASSLSGYMRQQRKTDEPITKEFRYRTSPEDTNDDLAAPGDFMFVFRNTTMGKVLQVFGETLSW